MVQDIYTSPLSTTPPDNYQIVKSDNTTLLVTNQDYLTADEHFYINAYNKCYTVNETKVVTSSYGDNGIIGGHTLVTSRFYLLWAMFSDSLNRVEYFGLTKQPYETSTNVATKTKGSSSVITVPNSYSFTIGAKISLYNAENDWNTATIVDKNATTITVVLDNAAYGYNLTSNTQIIQQYNKFKPYDLITGQLIKPYYKLLSSKQIYIYSSNLLLTTETKAQLTTIDALDKDLTTIAIHPDWQGCDGLYCINPLSQLVGTVIRNLNGNAGGADSPGQSAKKQMFLKGGATSGTGQLDAFQGHWHRVDWRVVNVTLGGSAIRSAAEAPGTQTDGDASTVKTDGVNGTPRIADETRPRNMTVYYIMKVI
jgi:hypothetical protein